MNTNAGAITVTVPAYALADGSTLVLSPDTAPARDRESLIISGWCFEIEVIPGVIYPARPITLTMSYTSALVAGLDESKLAIARYDDTYQRWVVLPSTPNPLLKTVEAETDHLSLFALVQRTAPAGYTGAFVYPNPYKPSSTGSQSSRGGVYFEAIPTDSRVQIYTINGEFVFEGQEENADGIYSWHAVNNDGEPVASGVYIYVLRSTDGTVHSRGKIAIVR